MLEYTAVKKRLAGLGYKLLKKDVDEIEGLIAFNTRHVLTYTHLKTLPEPLEHIVINLCAGQFLRMKKATGQLTDGQVEGAFSFSPAVESIKQGDRQTNFQSLSEHNATTPEKAFDDMLDELADLATYKQELDEYRRLAGKRPKRRGAWRTI